MVDTVTLNIDDFYTGKDYNKTYQLLDGTTPVDITSYTFNWIARVHGASTNALTKAMSLTTAASGLFSVALDSSDTDLTNGTVYAYQVQGTTDTGETYVYCDGEFIAQEPF